MRAVVAVGFLFFALLLAGCGGNGEEAAPEPETVEGTMPEEEPAPADEGAVGDPEAGRQVFLGAEPSCGGCHTFEAAGTEATVGPNLDESLEGKDAQEVRRDIVDPNAEVAEGFQAGVMPEDYEEKLSERELDDLVAFLIEQRGGG